jgi:PEP-CTERM motif
VLQKEIKMTTVSRTTVYAAAGIVLASVGSANATPMQLDLTATDETTHQVYTTIYSDVLYGTDTVTSGSSKNLISVPTGNQGALTFSGELSTSTVGSALNSLITSALTVTNNSATDTFLLTAALSGINFVGPSNEVSLTGSGTWQSTAGSVMTLNFYDDPADAMGANTPTDTPGNLVASYTSPAAADITSSYSYSPGTLSLAVPDTGLFSMTETWDYTLAPGGELVSRGQTESLSPVSTPEPGSLWLFGMGLIGLGLAVHHRKRLIHHS